MGKLLVWAGAIIMDVTVTVRTAAVISEIRGYPEFTIQIVLCAKRREIRGYPEFTIRDGTARSAEIPELMRCIRNSSENGTQWSASKTVKSQYWQRDISKISACGALNSILVIGTVPTHTISQTNSTTQFIRLEFQIRDSITISRSISCNITNSYQIDV